MRASASASVIRMKMLACPRCHRRDFLTPRSLRKHLAFRHERRGRTSRDPEKKKRAMGKCGECNKVVRADIVPHPSVSHFTGLYDRTTKSPIWERTPAVLGTVVKGPFAAPKGSKPWLVMCSHFGGCSDGLIRFQPIQFVQKTVPTKCNASCRSAKGPKCDCECGGDQHGAAFG